MQGKDIIDERLVELVKQLEKIRNSNDLYERNRERLVVDLIINNLNYLGTPRPEWKKYLEDLTKCKDIVLL
jgi:hypothetical protein